VSLADCIFCQIVEGKIPSNKIHEDSEVLAFEDIHPQAPTHVIVIPKKHIARLEDAREQDAALLGRVVERAAAIARDRKLAHFRLVANNGEGAGQSVWHVHFHLLGGRPLGWPPG
jgi:histidine triad (HIT) family protein